MKINYNKFKAHIIENKYILSDNNILFKSSHKLNIIFYKNRFILPQLLFLTVYFSYLTIKILLRSNNILWLKKKSDSKLIVYWLNNKYMHFADVIINNISLNEPIKFSTQLPMLTVKQRLFQKLVRFSQFIYTFCFSFICLIKRQNNFKSCNYYDIIHLFNSFQYLLHFKWNLNNSKNYTLLALNSDSATSAIHNYSDIRVISIFCEYIHTKSTEFNNCNWSEKLTSFVDLDKTDSIKIGAISPKLMNLKEPTLKYNIYIVDTCDIQSAVYNEQRIKTLSILYNNLDLFRYNCYHIFHPGISSNEKSKTLNLLPDNIKIFNGLEGIESIPKNSIVLGFHSTALFAFASLKIKVYVFNSLDGLVFEKYFESVPQDLCNLDLQALIKDNNDPDVIYGSLRFNNIDNLISYLSL
jgi:hypothetical protein